jgi:hypothetical protein
MGIGSAGRQRTTAPIAPRPLRRRIRGGLWALLATLLVAATVSGLGATLLLAQAAGPGQVANEFCQDLQGQQYVLAASLLSKTLRARGGTAAFDAAMRALDGAEGPVVACGADMRTLTSAWVVITRAKLGQLTGLLQLRQESGSWVIAGLATSLLGVSFGALRTTLNFCASLQASDYTTIYGLLAPSARGTLTGVQYAEQARQHDMIDGVAISCVLASIGQNNTDAAVQVTLTITRVRLAARTGALALAMQSGAWHITSVDNALQGTDLGPLLVGVRFCGDLVHGQDAAAYALTSTDYQARVSPARFHALFGALPSHWIGCTPELATYAVGSTTATYAATLVAAGGGAGQALRLAFTWVESAWWVGGVTLT